MTDQLISFETAKLAKEKGFNEYCNFCYDVERKDKGIARTSYRNYDSLVGNLSAPTQSLLQKWLREVQKTDIIINVTSTTNEYWSSIPNFIRGTWKSDCFKTYEEALEQGLIEALKLIP